MCEPRAERKYIPEHYYINTMISRSAAIIVYCLFVAYYSVAHSLVDRVNVTSAVEEAHLENALARLVKMFSTPGAFERVDSILGENTIEDSSSCPKGEEGLECRRAEARKSVDCPHGDCYCYNCALAGAEMWAPCCRESLRCCSHLAAACRNCDQPVLHPFCSKHFNKCLDQLHNETTTMMTTTTTSHPSQQR